MSDDRVASVVRFAAYMNAKRCLTAGHEDRPVRWTRPVTSRAGTYYVWVCDECHDEDVSRR